MLGQQIILTILATTLNTIFDMYSDLDFGPDNIVPRNNCDTITNPYCQLLLDLVTNNRLTITNGRTLGDSMGKNTCHKWNGSSTVDYFITSTDLRDNINSFEVLDFTSYSDHCPLLLSFNFQMPFQSVITHFDFDRMPSKYKWNEEGATGFVNVLNSPEITDKFNSILNKEYPNNKEHADIIVNDFSNVIQHCASQSLKSARLLKNVPHKKWFDRDCVKSKQNLNRLARNISKHPHLLTENKKVYFEQRNKHNTLIKQKKTTFLSRLNQSIEEGHVLNWKKFKQLKQTNENKITRQI